MVTVRPQGLETSGALGAGGRVAREAGAIKGHGCERPKNDVEQQWCSGRMIQSIDMQ